MQETPEGVSFLGSGGLALTFYDLYGIFRRSSICSATGKTCFLYRGVLEYKVLLCRSMRKYTAFVCSGVICKKVRIILGKIEIHRLADAGLNS